MTWSAPRLLRHGVLLLLLASAAPPSLAQAPARAQAPASAPAPVVTGRETTADSVKGYLPAQLSADEVDAIIAATIAEAGATGPKDMGKVMGLVKPKVAGRTDMGKLSEQVKARLAAAS